MIWKLLVPLAFLAIGARCMPGSALLGAKECTWGPSYWCKNLTSAHGCKAVSHCITTVWEHRTVDNDPDDICSICKGMVVEARDQLESNMTMDELKQVFEGSCKLIYVKPAVEICDKLSDELVPELVETIASQMNPDVVCSVAGLCNNQEIDVALESRNKFFNGDTMAIKDVNHYNKQNCDNCGKFINKMQDTIKDTPSFSLLYYLLDLCGKTSSFSDSCASIVLENFDDINVTLRRKIDSDEFCMLSGSCMSLRKPLPGDETCDLCQQLVLHFKDIVTADTTKLEFNKVLRGICKQTGKFAQECTSLVSQYSDELFDIISNDLDGKQICGFLNICPAPGVYINGPVNPMIPAQPIPVNNAKVVVSNSQIKVGIVSPIEKPNPTIVYGDDMSNVPVKQEQLMVAQPPSTLQFDTRVNDQQVCVFCQYALHYIQKVITQPYGQDAIKKVVDKMCDELPRYFDADCRQFVDVYGNAFVALLAQEIDPSQVCPSLKVCPAQILGDRYEPTPLKGKPGCPICMMIVSALDEEIENNKTEDSVKAALEKVCKKLPSALVQECDGVVDTYTEQLVDMMMADFTPEEVCSYLKLCKKPSDITLISQETFKTKPGDVEPYEVMTNEVDIPTKNLKSNSYDEEKVDNEKMNPVCIICEFVLEKVEDIIKHNESQADLDKALHEICNHLPWTIRKDCNEFIVKYAEEVINTLGLLVTPDQVCSVMGVCSKSSLKSAEQSISECGMCQTVAEIQRFLILGEDSKIDRVNFLLGVCAGVEDSQAVQCSEFIRSHGVKMFNTFMSGVSTDDLCNKLSICSSELTAKVDLKSEIKRRPLGGNKCTYGPTYWCTSHDNAVNCGNGAVKHCQEKVWHSEMP